MEEQYVVDRSKLREVWLDHPEWSKQQPADQVGRSKSWVKKCLRRIRGCSLDDQKVLQGQSPAQKHPPPAWPEPVIQRILELRDEPPKKLERTPGPLPIMYYLTQDPSLRQAGLAVPRSTRTIWKILDRYHRILRPAAQQPDPEE